MRTPFLSVLICLCLATAIGCKPRQTTPAAEVTPEPPTPDQLANACPPLLRSDSPPESNPISGLTAHMAGDCLELKATFSGGCKPHSFRLYWNGAHAESMPPQIGLTLVHDNGGDNCRELKSEKIAFNLKSARYSGVGQVIVNLSANGVPAQRVNYTY